MELNRVVEASTLSMRWPGRLRELAVQWRRPMEARARDAVLAELWKLLNVALQRYVRAQAGRFGRLDGADIVDVAADKALELLDRLERRQWDPDAGSDAQISGFLISVARNGVVDLVRRKSREAHAARGSTWAGADMSPAVDPRRGSDVESLMDGARYARAIVACAGCLTARARLAWFLRVFCGLPPPEIARHPGILTSTGGVHLILNRSRRHMRKCMQSKGLEPGLMPPGTFAALWDLIDAERRSRGERPRPERAS